jgi:hypothetical protein
MLAMKASILPDRNAPLVVEEVPYCLRGQPYLCDLASRMSLSGAMLDEIVTLTYKSQRGEPGLRRPQERREPARRAGILVMWPPHLYPLPPEGERAG